MYSERTRTYVASYCYLYIIVLILFRINCVRGSQSPIDVHGACRGDTIQGRSAACISARREGRLTWRLSVTKNVREKVRVGGGVSERRKTPDEATSSAGFEVSWAVWA